MSLAAVVFDVDGTLADTEQAHRQAFNATFGEFGLPWHWDSALYLDLLAVAGGRERLAHYCRRVDPRRMRAADADAFIAGVHRRKTEIYEQRVAAGETPARPGVLRLIRELRQAGVRLAIATTTSRRNVEVLLATTLGSLPPDSFAVIGAGEDATAKKPAPDIYRYVLDRLGLRAEDCLAIEDSRNGLQAAQGAGLPTLVTVNAWTDRENFDGALAVLSDLGEPARPLRVLSGTPNDIGHVDVAALQYWHRAWQMRTASSPVRS